MQIELKIIVIILQSVSIVLLSVLLATPARKHPIVNTIIVLAIIRAIVDVLPPFLAVSNLYDRALSQHPITQPALRRFCIADAIILNYLTLAKSAFAISFTIPCLYLALKFTGAHDRLDADSSPQFYRRTVLVLCVGPFVWASPIVFAMIPKLIHNTGALIPALHGPTCIVSDSDVEILTLILMLIPLAISAITSGLLGIILVKHYKLADFRHSMELLHPIRVVRFALLISTIIVSTVLYSVVLSMWVRNRDDKEKWGHSFEAWLLTSSTWEAISPLVFFCIFAAQEVYSMWYSWLCRHLPCFGGRRSSNQETSCLRKPRRSHASRRPSRAFTWLLEPRGHNSRAHDTRDTYGQENLTCDGIHKGACEPAPPPDRLQRHIVHYPQVVGNNCLQLQQEGLSPAPRSPRSRSQTPQKSRVFRTIPSLSALGSREAAGHGPRLSPPYLDSRSSEVDDSGCHSQSSTHITSEGSRYASDETSHIVDQTGTFGRCG
ncbi:uncharacterized protein LAESUDRAFT_396631 [Laetiporus sulphureus 93-53]|uniref:Uncharacterized protein n=1 Tax=Laetiporus sulphureus 93-53 TaxID=1314785 RepID=A0A165CEU4_9APHY|nr:uncharacterized protein LAESUDRAFT_396631 [Laetiporus sulphureus 93-53]KZT02685.1 hypothetical protein LAESUDRAFT_396631 [Laetiporus sulphureus 93-53]